MAPPSSPGRPSASFTQSQAGRHAGRNRPLRERLLFPALGAAFAGAVALSAAAAHARYLPSGATLPGLMIDGVVVPPDADVRAFVAARAEALRARRVAFAPAPEPHAVLIEGSLGEFGVNVDVDRLVALATRLGHEGDLVERASLAERARRGELDLPLEPTVDTAVALARFLPEKERLDHAPVSARLDIERHEVKPERDGRYLDAYAALAGLDRAAREASVTGGGATEASVAVAVVPVVPFPPRMTSAFLRGLDVSQVIGSFETHFSRGGEQSRRGKNIDVGASKLEGLVLTPGELLSFNEVVGERSEDNGFQKSWEIFKGEMVEGVGGGTCQVASTFHAAAFFGGLEVLERLPHSRPSAYIPMGLDSTVVYPAVDLKLRNPHPFPVVVHTRSSGNTLRVELLGAQRPVRVAFKRELVKTFPYKRKLVEDDALRGSTVVLKQHGIRGFKVKRTREIFYPDGTKKTEETTDAYPPTWEIYEVPPGFDESLLPALPDETDADADADAAAPVSTAPVADVAAGAGDGALAAIRREAESRGVDLIEAKGVHPPTKAQADPPKELKILR